MPEAKNESKWQFGSGLRDDYDFTVYVATFRTDAQVDNGETYFLELTGVDEEDEEVSERYRVGKDWDSPDGGASIVHPKGPKHRVNRNTAYATFCQKAIEAGAGDWLEKTGDPLVADTWINTKWHMKEVRGSFTDRITKEEHEYFRNYPSTFYGIVDEDGNLVTDKPKAKKTTAIKAPAKAADVAARRAALAQAAASASNGVEATTASPFESGSLLDQLYTLAQENSPQEFMSLALDIDDVVTDEDIASQVIDTTEEGFYSKYHQ